MQINDTAFPAPSLVPFSSVSAGAVARRGDSYLVKAVDGSAFDLSANVPVTVQPADLVQPVAGELVITAP